MTAVASAAIETQHETETEASEGDQDHLTIDHLDVSSKQTPIPPVATIVQEKERTDTQVIEETSENGIEIEVTGDKSEILGERKRRDHLEESGTCLMIEDRVDEEAETGMRFKEVVGIERRAHLRRQRRRSPLRT